MKKYSIHVNGKPYQGEEVGKCYPNATTDPHSTQSFHAARVDLEMLKLGKKNEEPVIIYGNSGIRSALDRILTRIAAGVLDVETIKITCVGEEDFSIGAPKRMGD